MARRERRAKRMADWYGLAVEGERGAAAKKQCVARAEEVAEKLPPGAAKGLQNAAPSGPEGIDPITMERLLSQVQKGGPSVQNEALVAVTGLPPQHAAKLLEFALEKSKELRDPSMYMVSTVARGFKPRWHEMVEASVPSKGKGVQLELAQDRKPHKARSVLLGEFSHRPEISGRPATSGFSFPCAWWHGQMRPVRASEKCAGAFHPQRNVTKRSLPHIYIYIHAHRVEVVTQRIFFAWNDHICSRFHRCFTPRQKRSCSWHSKQKGHG
ncbi:unnamed protein product [Durusdinium trenchii]|uniref:Uncharacterized protein n=1 Tax=Durusdinium trenchii TaxID=1381693 RepID=A0ABP0LKH5_9DINO